MSVAPVVVLQSQALSSCRCSEGDWGDHPFREAGSEAHGLQEHGVSLEGDLAEHL